VVHTVIPALGRLRQEDQEFEAKMAYVVLPCQQQQKRHYSKIIIYPLGFVFNIGNSIIWMLRKALQNKNTEVHLRKNLDTIHCSTNVLQNKKN
jgi:hypothetical protein